MNKNKLLLIIKREFTTRVKKKSFIIMTILTPILLASFMVIPIAISTMTSGDTRSVMIIDRSEIAEPYLVDNNEYIFTFDKNADIDKIKENFTTMNLYAVIEISALDANHNATITSYSTKQLGVDAKRYIERSIKQAIEDNKLAKYEIADIDRILKEIKTNVSVKSLIIGTDGNEKAGMVEVYMGISYILGFLIYFFVFLFGSMVMRGVIEEKTNRIVEIMISSIKPFQLMLGKIFGIGSVALVQFVVWITLTFGIVFCAAAIMTPDVSDIAAHSTMLDSNIAGMGTEELTGAIENSSINDLMNVVRNIPLAQILISFTFFFLFGYLLYASMFAAIGSAVDNEADTQQLIMPVTLPLIIGIFIMMHTFQHPDSSLSFWGSIIPFTSPMVMVARVPFGVPVWELALSIGLLIATFILMTYISAKIYRVGILAYGKKATWKDLIKWIKY